MHFDPWRDFDVIAFADAFQGGERPMQCAILFIGGSPFAWRIGRLAATSLSATEAEWFAQTLCSTLLQSNIPIIDFMGADITLPIISFCDNSACVTISEKDMSTKRLKHVRTRMAYLQEQRDNGSLVILHLSKDAMIADIGTKVLPASSFHHFRQYLVWE